MPNLTPSSGQKRSTPGDAPITRVVVVRESSERVSKNVRLNDDPSRFGARTGFWTAIGLGTVAFLWLTGHFGETLGFARALGMPELAVSSDHGLATGVRMVLSVPLRIFEMALVDPLRLAVAFAVITIPAAGLAVARPRVPGGPPLSKMAAGLSTIGLVLAGLVFALLITWIAWPDRRATLGLAPMDRHGFGAWLDAATAVAGFDALALVAGILWLVLLFRLPLPRVAIAIGAVAGFIAIFATWTGFAVSNGIIDGSTQERPIIVTLTGAIEGNAAKSLLLGTMHGKTTVMGAGERPSPMVLPAPEFLVSERTTLATWMKPPRVE